MGVHRVRQLYRGLHLEPHKGNTTMRGSWPEWRWPAGHILALFIGCITTLILPVLQVGRRLAERLIDYRLACDN